MKATIAIHRHMAGVSLAAMAAFGLTVPAHAQAAPAQPAAVAPQAQTDDAAAPRNADIVVTGSRITTSGFNAPTPTTVIGEEQIANNAQPNIFTTIAQLPSLQGSTGASTGTFSTSSGQQGLSSFSLRGLGAIRTLTLLDGQRVVGANVTGVPDISMFPQLLVKRVDVVTGGASASYGSDAVGGVVNFITDTHFEGFKGNILGSITKYGDDETALVQAAYGKAFLDDRLHVVLSGEFDHEGGVGAGDFGTDLAGSRDWYRATTLMNTGQTSNGLPQFNYRDYAQPYQYARYGLINNGPLQGIAFDQNGTPYNFNYGSGGQPTGTGAVTNCYRGNSFCEGGDLSGAPGSGASLKSALERINGYGRIGYDFADNNEAYVTVNIAQVKTSNQPSPGYNRSSLTVQCANPYLPQSVRDQCALAGITQFGFGTSNGSFPDPKVHTDRRQYRFVGGLKGKFDLGGTDWNYDAYYEHGITISDIRVQDIVLQNRYVAATNAIMLNGAIVCADPAARAAGCQPINIFGGATPSSAALAYVAPHENGPFQHTKLTQDVASLNFSGNPFELWAGPVSVAFGGEYRREFYRVNADPYGAGVSALSPNSPEYPADPLLNSTLGSNWAAGNYKNGRGKYEVYEGYLEVDLPLFNSDSMGRANLNAAGRGTHYSTSGTVWTWKVGGTWDTPLSGLRLRAVTSRDVRAPNLSELFAAPTVTTLPNFNDPFRNQAVQVFQNTIGNTALKPEVARNTELGIVLARPEWMPGLSLSLDYYDIKLKGVVSSLSADQIVRFCFEGNQAFCGGFQLDGAQGTNFVNVQPFNLASWRTSGFDIEASYQWQQPLGLPGSFTVRALATHIRKFIVNAGIAGVDPVDQAGANTGATPDWKWLAVQTYDSGRFSLTVQERWISDGVFGNQYVVCQSSCPVSTGNHPTIDRNKMKGAFYVDVGATFKIRDTISIYGKVDNLFDKDPVASPQTNTGLDVNPALYDTLGRIYRAGVRFNF
ncbi:MAG: TonB-dependent receptor [Sphingobium sp.]|uniref:TonB-dependent receptor n=1 Tax=Sphingomonas bisphenolicum TaxID=296544 RepID=A0ABN5WJM8_9SPHN|nr:TonB-dependent receptor [Sphingomonas bisphenolicum]MBA4090188.1 TonB-dependent receptor [Sphingobium sp.]BBF72265.1 TonB-dependent receptor [Sphingomonas bisphenolicum]